MDSNKIDIKVVAKDLSDAVLKDVRKNLQGITGDTNAASKSGNILTGVVAGLTASIASFGLSIISSGIDKLKDFLGDSVAAATDFEKSMTTLSIIAPRFGVNADKAKEAAQALGKELRIGVGPAAESLQNLLKGGLNLDQAQELMRRFTNEAITGKSSSISLAQAVQNLSFAYTTNNSALGNLSGISENFSDITEKGRQALLKQGVAASKITDDMAKFKGMMDLTNLTLGSAEYFTGTLMDTQAQLGLRFDELKLKVGQALAPILNNLLQSFMELSDTLGPILQPILDKLLGYLGPILNIVSSLAKVMFGLVTNTGDAMGSFDALVKALGLSEEGAVKLSYILGDISLFFNNLKDTVVQVAQYIMGLFNNALNSIKNSMSNIQPALEKILAGIGRIWEILSENLGPVLDFVFNQIFKPIVEWLSNNAGPILEHVFNAIATAIEFIGNALQVLFDIAKPILEGLFQIFSNVFNGIKEVIRVVIDLVQNLLVPVLQIFFTIAKGVFDGVVNAIRPVVEFLREKLSPGVNQVKDTFVSAFEGIKTVVSSVWNVIQSIIKGGIDYIIGQINSFIRSINSALNGIDQVGKGLGINVNFRVGEIPRYANGTNFHPGGMAIVGERGPELVNLPRGSQVIPNGGGMTNNFYGYDASQISTTINNQISLGY